MGDPTIWPVKEQNKYVSDGDSVSVVPSSGDLPHNSLEFLIHCICLNPTEVLSQTTLSKDVSSEMSSLRLRPIESSECS